jgi:ATP-dependent helicase/nuclease subunit A
VLVDAGGEPQWWVLDYKIQHAPQDVGPWREQLQRYRQAVQRLQPRARVRAAFITGAGELVEPEDG